MSIQYVVLRPSTRGNPTDKHLVVTSDEWVSVSLGKADEYTDVHECSDYDEAATQRDVLNAIESRKKATA